MTSFESTAVFSLSITRRLRPGLGSKGGCPSLPKLFATPELLKERQASCYQERRNRYPTLHAKFPDHDPELNLDYEFTLQSGVIYTSDHHWFSVGNELATSRGKDIEKVFNISPNVMIHNLH